jgi:hypothetical protein
VAVDTYQKRVIAHILTEQLTVDEDLAFTDVAVCWSGVQTVVENGKLNIENGRVGWMNSSFIAVHSSEGRSRIPTTETRGCLQEHTFWERL